MSELNQIYVCERCGYVIEVVGTAQGELTCCHTPMILQEPKTADSATEKHVPIVEGSKVVVGSTAHPMTEEHQICWIEIINGDYVNRKYLNPGDAPEAEFYVDIKPGMILREYCNQHGLWEYKV